MPARLEMLGQIAMFAHILKCMIEINNIIINQTIIVPTLATLMDADDLL
jgi:hypothetical protein